MASKYNWSFFLMFTFFLLKKLATDKTKKTNKKIKEKIIKWVKEPILIDEIANENIENKAKKVKNLQEVVKVVNEIK